MQSEKVQSGPEPLDLIWGADGMAAEIGLPRRSVFYMLERGFLPAKKIGRKWVISRAELRATFRQALAKAA